MTLAIFDLDFTLLEGDSEWLWSEFLLEQGIVGEDFTEQIARYYRDYEAEQVKTRRQRQSRYAEIEQREAESHWFHFFSSR